MALNEQYLAAVYFVYLVKGEIAATPLVEVFTNKKPLDRRLLELARVLAK